MNYKHLTIEERCCLREYYLKGYSYRKIAKLMGRSPSTISREINRNKTYMNVKPAYYPHTAQKKYKLRRSYCHRGMFHNQEILTVYIAGANRGTEYVQRTIMRLPSLYISFIARRVNDNRDNIKDLDNYIAASLFNSARDFPG